MLSEEEIEKYRKAGKILKQVRDYSKSLIKENASIIETIRELETKITELGGENACPINISINDIAAHDCADINDTRVFKKGDLVKIDFGVHVDGYIADSGYSIEVGSNNYSELIKTAKNALENVIKILRPEITLSEIGRTIEETAREKGFQPIINLSGHSIERFNLHAGISTPNIDTHSNYKIPEGTVIAIEPFITTGKGIVNEVGKAKIYEMVKKVPVRIDFIRKIQKHIEKNYNNLPFANRWLSEKGFKNVDYALNNLLKKNALKSYPPLREASGAPVAYAEHTIILLDEPIITTK